MERAAALTSTDAPQAVHLWLGVETITSGMGGGNGEILGGLWTLLVSVAAWRVRSFPAPLGVVGILAGAAGTTSALPGLSMMIAPFGLLQLLWFVGLGVVLLRRRSQDRRRAPQATAG